VIVLVEVWTRPTGRIGYARRLPGASSLVRMAVIADTSTYVASLLRLVIGVSIALNPIPAPLTAAASILN